MKIKAIAHSYWRVIKAGRRTFESVRDEVKDDVRYLARSDVKNGLISAEQYFNFIGEEYEEEKD